MTRISKRGENRNIEDKISAHAFLGKFFGDLREIWIEIPGDCPLDCVYCFATDSKIKHKKPIDDSENVLSAKEVVDNIRQFDKEFPLTKTEKIEGIKKGLAIPAVGEPFFTPRMKEYVFAVLDYCFENDIIATIFTTGHLINEDIANRLNKYGHNLRLFIKYNSQNPKIQDALVRVKGYTKQRDKALKLLMSKGFNDGRLGIVTSIMKANFKEMPKLLRFARNNGIQFDADTIISRGRGGRCNCNFKPKEIPLLKNTLRKLQKIDKKEYGHEWDIIPTYVGSAPCTRFEHHLYIKINGAVHPCVGSDKVILGDTRKQSLKEIWSSRITKIIRSHNYKGKCLTCKNYQEHKCYSCLGRSTSDLTTEFLRKYGYVKTVGCWNYRPDKETIKEL